jgi:hypothetical protein
MIQTKRRKIHPNFRKTRRKQGGMPPRLDPKAVAQAHKLQAKLAKKRQGESPRQTLEYTQAAYDNYLADLAQRELDKKNAEEERERLAKEAVIAAKEEKAQKAANAKAIADKKALEAANAKAASDTKKKAEDEKAKETAEIAAQKKAAKDKANEEKEERKKLRAAEAAAEAERIRSQKEAEKKDKKAEKKAKKAEKRAKKIEEVSATSNSSYASARSELSTTASPYTIPPIDRKGKHDPVFWSQFFKPGEIENYADSVTIDYKKFFIPEAQEDGTQFGPVLVDYKNTARINRALCKLIRIFGIMEAKFSEHQFEYELIWKGTRAITLATGVVIDTKDIDIEIVNRNGREESESDKENRMRLASHICILIQDLLHPAPLSTLYPGDDNSVNPDILKLSYVIGSGYVAILDLCFNKIYTKEIGSGKTKVVVADRNEKFVETITNTGLYKHPSIASMKAEKTEYLRAYTIENMRSDIKKMNSGLEKIDDALGETKKKTASIQMTEDDKRIMQARITERLKLSKAEAQSRKLFLDNTASKP